MTTRAAAVNIFITKIVHMSVRRIKLWLSKMTTENNPY